MRDNIDDDDCLPTAETLAALFAALKPVAPPPGLESKVRARIAATPNTLITVRADAGQWRELAPGVRVKVLTVDRSANTHSLLVEMDAGASMPAHDHATAEECLVLQGEVALGDIVVRAGDFHCAPAGVPHGPVFSAQGVLMFVRGDFSEMTAAL